MVFASFPHVTLASRDEVIEVFRKYQELNESFLKDVGNIELRRSVEEYSENFYGPKLSEAKSLVCKKKDRVILKAFMNVLVSTRNSANEYPSWVLGEMFLCQSELVVSEFKKFDQFEEEILYGKLEFGFLNVTYKKERVTPRYDSLKQLLESLRP